MRTRRFLHRAAVVVLLVLLAACFRGEAARIGNEPLRIGAIYPLSGPLGPYGTAESRGVETAVDLFNSQGGLHGRSIKLELADAPDVDSAWRQAYRLVRLGVPAIIGTYGSTLSIAASEVAHRSHVVYWETGGVADLITSRGYPEVFRTGPSGATLAAQAAAFSVEVIAPHYKIPTSKLRLAVVYENDPYGSSVGDGIRHEAAARGFNLVGSFPYDPLTEDFTGIIPKLKAERPDIVVAASYLEDGARFREAVLDGKLQLKALIGKCAAFFTQAMANILGNKIDGVFVSDKPMEIGQRALLPEGSALEQTMRARYQARYAEAPTAPVYMGFSGAWAFLSKVLAAATAPTPDAIRKAALAVDIPAGALPNGAGVRFASGIGSMAGQNLRALGVVWQWQKGVPVLVFPREAARGVPLFASS